MLESIGVNNSLGQLFMQGYGSVASTGAFVKAPYMSVSALSNVPLKYTAVASGVTMPTMHYNTASLAGLTNYSMTTSGTVPTGVNAGNYYDLTIGTGLTVTVDGNTFHTITIGKNSKVTFTAPVVNAYSIVTSANARLLYTQNTEMRVSRSVRLGTGNKVNNLGKIVTFYVGDLNAADEFKVDEGGLITANVYAPDLGTMTVASSTTAPTTMNGTYIAYQVVSTGKNVTWNTFDCTTPPTFIPREAEPVVEISDQFEVRVSPNPSASIFTLTIMSGSDEPATVRLMDISGRVLVNRTISDSGLPIDIGEGLSAGNYFAEVIQGQNKKVLKLTKIE